MAQDMEYYGNPCLTIADNIINNIKKYESDYSILNAVVIPFFITNQNQEIVYFNELFNNLEFINLKDKNFEATEGCQVNSSNIVYILKSNISEASINNKECIKEHVLILNNNKMQAIKIMSKPIFYNEKKYIMTSILDITKEKKDSIVLPVYNHDLVNVAGGLAAYLDVMRGFSAEDIKAQIPDLKSMADKILDIALIQREITRAEKDTLIPEILGVTFEEIIEGIKDKIRYNELDSDNLILSEYDPDFEFEADERLLMRVVGNLCINAIERDKKAYLDIEVQPESDTILFSIHNTSCIPQEQLDQIFNYGFTTKGKGRGQGCYAAKLIGVNVLKGNIWFESDKENGTTFYFKIPRVCPEDDV